MLGTAQLGSDYGIANWTGRPDAREAANILNRAWQAGIRVLDTARAYGDSESIIGHFLERHPECPFDVVSKLEPAVDPTDRRAVEAAVKESGDRMGRPPMAMLLHDAPRLSVLATGGRDAFRRCINDGLTAAFGVSVYT
ncbi:MAG: aldo/keto reductase, partial [Rhodospirillales bacterium]